MKMTTRGSASVVAGLLAFLALSCGKGGSASRPIRDVAGSPGPGQGQDQDASPRPPGGETTGPGAAVGRVDAPGAARDGAVLANVDGASGPSITVAFDLGSPQQTFGASRMEAALRERNLQPVRVAIAQAQGSENIQVRIVDASANPSIKKEGFRFSRAGGNLVVSAVDESGALYGLLELADQIALVGLAGVPDRTVNPRFPFRAIKFNLPWSSYRVHSALQLHTETVKDPKFWERFLDMMAENRFNALTLWNLHPFPYLIRSKSFPKACPFSDAELATWQSLWRNLFRMAAERGIETYLVNWNIFVSKGFKDNYEPTSTADGETYLGDGMTSAKVEAYTKESVTQVLDEYPDLTGIGITLGEMMGGMTPEAREDWLVRTVVAGIKAAKRPAKFIHRVPLSANTGSGGSTNNATEVMTRNAIESMGFPTPIEVEMKFNWSHAFSSPKLVQVHGGSHSDTYWNPAPTKHRIDWMVRNEDIFLLRWGQPDFIRKHIAMNGQEHVGGYFLGSECYIPAQDYLHTRAHAHVSWTYAFERQWLMYQQWGRLLFDPTTPDRVFELSFDRRYGTGTGARMVKAFQLASDMPLQFGALLKTTWDFTSYAEGFLMPTMTDGKNDNASNFLSLEELMDHSVLDPAYLSVKDYVDRTARGPAIPDSMTTPPELADTLQKHAEDALALLAAQPVPPPGLACEMADVSAWSHLSLYFAEKLRAAVALQTFTLTKGGTERTTAVSALEKAKVHWQNLVTATQAHYPEVPLIHTGRVNFAWGKYSDQVERDLTVAKAYR